MARTKQKPRQGLQKQGTEPVPKGKGKKRKSKQNLTGGDASHPNAGFDVDPDFRFDNRDADENPSMPVVGDSNSLSTDAAVTTNSNIQKPNDLAPDPSTSSNETKAKKAKKKRGNKRSPAQRLRDEQRSAKFKESEENAARDRTTIDTEVSVREVDAPRPVPPSVEMNESAVSAKDTIPPKGNALTEGDDFISLNFDDDDMDKDDEAGEDSTSEGGKPTVFSNIAEKLGKFVKESNDPSKRKRDDTSSKKSRKRKREIAENDPYPWLQGKSYAKEQEPARILHRELLDFVNFVGPTDEEHRVRNFIISRIKKLVEKKWPTASLHVFGSFETKLYLPTSDIDLVVLSAPGGEVYERPNHLRRLANWLVKARIAENIQVITSARVPIIKFIDRVTKINVDISFNKPTGLIAAQVVKSYIEKMPALRPLVVFIKHFLNMRGMNEVYLGGLGSYSIICMVISFLQRHPKIASGQITQEDNLGVLVVEFFELYGKRFNYDNVGININNDGKYFSKLDYGWQRAGQSYLLSIEDPTDPDNDIAKSSFGILKVKSTFGGGHDFLVQRLYDVNDRIKARRRGDIGLDSILSAVVSVDEDMKEGRAYIATCYDSKEVQDELRDMELSDGEIEEGSSLSTRNVPKANSSSKLSKTEFVADEETDEELIDNDGHVFVRPNGYKKPSTSADMDDLYSKLNTAPTRTITSRRTSSKESPESSKSTEAQPYLIESSDDEKNARIAAGSMNGTVINLDSDAEDHEQDSKVAQVDKSMRNRYWEAKGKEEVSQLVDHDSGSEYGI